MSFRTVRQKFFTYLIDLSQASGSDIVDLDKTRTALAEYFGISRQSLEREITRMAQDGLLRIQKKTIQLVDKNKLIQLIRF